MRPSIRKQLVTVFMPFLFGLWIMSAILTYWLVSSFARESFDRQLINSADSVAGRLRLKEGNVVIDLPPAALAILKNDESDKFFFRVIREDGKIVSGDSNLPLPSSDLVLDLPRVGSASVSGNSIRLAEIKVKVEDGKDESQTVIVQVAETTNVRGSFQHKMLLSIALPQFMLISIGTFACWYVVLKILTPLRLLQKQLSTRSQSDLRSVSDEGVPEEVFPLIIAINQLLGRLKEELKAQQRFIANAAHQLRTPLAGLKTYSSIGTEMSDPKELKHIVDELDIGLDRSARLINQLLALARSDLADHEVELPKKPIDLNFIVSDVTSELIERAVLKEINLKFAASSEPAIVFGDSTGLRNLTANLVENAISYTPKGGRIIVQLFHNGQTTLKVSDTGCGIAIEERERVFERFYRIPGTVGDGSGLGLAIVKEVAAQHHATVAIDSGADNVGCNVVVTFPPKQP